LGQAFFSLSVGFGIIFTYASYVKKDENVIKMSVQTALADTIFAIIAGVAIMPAVFSFGISAGQGPGLVFVTLPYVFSQLPLGSVIGFIFFFVLFIAAITSLISLMEVVVAFIIEVFNLSRRAALALLIAVILCLGTLCSLSQGVLSDVKILGNNFFDLFDKTSANILIPVGALLIVLFAGWKMKRADFMDEITSGGLHKINPLYLKVVMFSVKYVAPIIITIIMVRSLI
jgi:NSS family neurotransmitter:Na+ symporter